MKENKLEITPDIKKEIIKEYFNDLLMQIKNDIIQCFDIEYLHWDYAQDKIIKLTNDYRIIQDTLHRLGE